MELPHIGQTCVICNRNDYLPFKCQHCQKIVCIDHKADHGSDCPLTRTSFDSEAAQRPANESIRQSCDFCKKITLKLELSECQHCHSNLCLYHRHQVQHSCVKLAEDTKASQLEKDARAQRQQEALDRLKNIQVKRDESKPKTTSHVAPSQLITHKPLDPKKQALARRVRIMRIKQSARGPPNVLDQDKIFFEVKFQHEPRSSLSNESKHNDTVNIFSTPKHTVGRLVDFAATELDLNNRNHIENSDQLVFLVGGSDSSAARLDCQNTFQSYIETGVLDSGDQLFMTYELRA